MSLGIQQLKAVVKMGLCIGELIDGLADGVSFADIPVAWRAAKAVKPAFDAVKSGQLIPELKDLKADEIDELKVLIEELDLRSDSLEQSIEEKINYALDLAKTILGA